MKEHFPNNYFNLKRKVEDIGKPVSFGDINLEISNQYLYNRINGKSVHLTSAEYQVLHLLINSTQNDVPINIRDIENYYYQSYPQDRDLPLGNSIVVFIYRLRKKLKEIKSKVEIPTFVKEGHEGIKLNFEK